VSCKHVRDPLAVAQFQVCAAAWIMDYCRRCGERRWFVRNPFEHEPIIDQETGQTSE
jgi:hypothetical protein